MRATVGMAEDEVGNEDGVFEVYEDGFAFHFPIGFGFFKAFGKGFFEQGIVHRLVFVVRDQVVFVIESEVAFAAIFEFYCGFHFPAGAQEQRGEEDGHLNAVFLREAKQAHRTVEYDFVSCISVASNVVNEAIEFDEFEKLLVTCGQIAMHG